MNMKPVIIMGHLIIPSGTEQIYPRTYEGNMRIRSVIVPESVKTIGVRAFANCKNLEEVCFDKRSQCEVIGEGAFGGCYFLREIVFPVSLRLIGQEAFCSCLTLQKVFVPATVEAIGVRAFFFCENLKMVKITGSKTSVFRHAFGRCSKLEIFTYGRKTYVVLPSFRFSGVIVAKCNYSGAEFCKLKRIETCYNGEINGEILYNCAIKKDESVFIGQGETVRRAYADCLRFINAQEREKELQNISIDSIISAYDYQAIARSCYYGIRDFCKLNKIDIDKGRKTVREIGKLIEPIKEEISAARFWAFYQQKLEEEKQGKQN